MLEDDDLKAAFRRVEPPAGFEHRVLARLNETSHPAVVPGRRFTAWAAAAAMACASVAGVAIYHHEREQQRAMVARDQLLQALQITGKTLDAVREQINKEDRPQ